MLPPPGGRRNESGALTDGGAARRCDPSRVVVGRVWRERDRDGLSPVEVIRAATLLPARFLSRSEDPDFGRVATGKRADLLLVDGDPTADISALADIREVIAGGVRLEREAITGGG